jgi:hypothetical protein
METTTSKRQKGYRLPLDSCIPGHLYQTGDGLSIFFSPHKNPPLSPKLQEVLDIRKSGLVSIEPIEELIINGKIVRLYKFTRKKQTVLEVISFESILEDLLLVTASYGPKFIGNIAAREILPKLQQLGKTFNATVYSPCERFMHDYHGQIFGFKIFGEKEDQVSKHNYSKPRICMAGYVLVVCEK